MPVINSKENSKITLARTLIKNIKPILNSDYKLVKFFDLYLKTLLAHNIILDFKCYIWKDMIKLDLLINQANTHFIIEINRNNGSYILK